MAAGKRGFAPARRGTAVPRVVTGKYKTSEAIKNGSLLVLDANGELVIFGGGTDTVVTGVALQAAETNLGYGEPFSDQTQHATGREQTVSYAVNDAEQEFSAQLQSDANTIVAPLQTHIGEEYGVAVRADGSWYIDTGETTTKIVHITDIVEAAGGNALGFVICRFLASTRAENS